MCHGCWMNVNLVSLVARYVYQLVLLIELCLFFRYLFSEPNGRKSASEAKQTDKKDVKVKGKWVNQVGLVLY